MSQYWVPSEIIVNDKVKNDSVTKGILKRCKNAPVKYVADGKPMRIAVGAMPAVFMGAVLRIDGDDIAIAARRVQPAAVDREAAAEATAAAAAAEREPAPALLALWL